MDPDQSYARAPQLSDYLGVLRARRTTIIALALVGLLLAGIYLATRSPSYASTAEVQVNVDPAANGGIATNLQTEVAIADSSDVALLAAKQLPGSLSVEDVLNRIAVTAPSDANILDITCTDEDPAFAQRCAQAVATGYTQYKAQKAQNLVQSKVDSLASELATIESDLAAVDAQISDREAQGDTTSAAYQSLLIQKSQLQIKAQLNIETSANLQQSDVASSTVLSPAGPASRTDPAAPLVLVAGALVGLFLGVVAAFVLEALSGRVREANDVERELGSPVIGVVPITKKERAQVVTRDFPGEPAAEAYRLLRSGLLFAAKGQHRVVMVTSAGVGDGKSTTAANVAVTLAQAGHETVLVGGDLRRPDLHTLFDVPNTEGLVQVLALGADPALLPTGVERLRLLPSGPPAEQSAHLFETDAFPALMGELREQAEFVVVDAPPLAISDPLLMAPSMDMVLFVVDAGKATRRALHRTRELLERIGLPQMGVALNKYKGHWAPSGGSGAYYYRRSKDEPIETTRPVVSRTSSRSNARTDPIATAAPEPNGATDAPAERQAPRNGASDASRAQASRSGRPGDARSS